VIKITSIGKKPAFKLNKKTLVECFFDSFFAPPNLDDLGPDINEWVGGRSTKHHLTKGHSTN
jgi:hypothetical protein